MTIRRLATRTARGNRPRFSFRSASSEPSSVPAASPTFGAVLPWLAVAWFMVIVALRGWLCDDAFISFRFSDNFIHGRGLVFNVGERVQGFTNPLWTLLYALPHGLPGDPYAKAMLFSLFVSAAAATVLAFGFSKNPLVGAVGVVTLAFSEAAGDFATSGLENPLSHLLVLAFAASFLREGTSRWHALGPWLSVGFALTNRMDLAPLFVPGLLFVASRQIRESSYGQVAKRALLGLSPFLLWEAFSLVYYGFLVPNTAIAKLGVDLPRAEVIGQGATYLLVTAERDPMTLLVLITAIVCGTTSPRTRPLALGVLLQLAYVVWAGGDFMAGRFLSAPLYLAAAVCLTLLDDASEVHAVRVAAAAIAFVALLSPYAPFGGGPPNQDVPPSGIVSEREFYRGELGLTVNLRRRAYRKHSFYLQGVGFRNGAERVVFHNNAGLTGYAAGPTRHLVDGAGLTDPFMARMPRDKSRDWRIGHYGRETPPGYLPTVRTGRMELREPRHRELYERLRLITQGPIFSVARLRAIVWMHTHRFGLMT